MFKNIFNIRIAQLNVRSIIANKKWNLLKNIIHTQHFDIILIQDWISNAPREKCDYKRLTKYNHTLNGYKFHCDNTSTGIFYKHFLDIEHIDLSEQNKNDHISNKYLKASGIKLILNAQDKDDISEEDAVNIFSIYRPQRGKPKQLSEFIEYIQNKYPNYIIAGDINAYSPLWHSNTYDADGRVISNDLKKLTAK